MIAIIDFQNQDIGLKILYPEADYYILEEQWDRTKLNSKYKISPIIHKKHLDVYQTVTSKKYDTLFVIAPLYDVVQNYNGKKNVDFFRENTFHKLQETIPFIKNNNFSTICFFDNSDYDCDPNIAFSDLNFVKSHNIRFFKRYYNKDKQYESNVSPFPYIIFGHNCMIDLVTDRSGKDVVEKIPRVFFSGGLFHHIDNVYDVDRNRIGLYRKLNDKIQIHNPGQLPHEKYMIEMASSKYCLDLLGAGDPNVRTFEIMSVGSLRMGQHSNLEWPFPDEFSKETIFKDENDFIEKITRLERNPELYRMCLEKQNEIVEKYMNLEYMRKYINGRIRPTTL